MTRRTFTLAATTSPVSWTVQAHDDFDVVRVDLVFDSNPSADGEVTFTRRPSAGAAYDAVILKEDPTGQPGVSLQDVKGFSNGDSMIVSYDNPDGVSVSGTAVVEL